MKLYIDTNIYRSYVSSTSDIKSLEKLKKLIIQNKVELVFPSQTKKEFLKHFKEGIKQTQDKLKKVKTKVVIPNELKNDKYGKLNEEDKKITEKIETLNADLEKYRIQKISEFKKYIEVVDKLLTDIFKLATFFESTDDVVLRAVVRYAKDLPPKKNDHKYGDAIIWETLKENIKREEIVVVSTDPDFSEIKNKKSKGIIKKILSHEWKRHSGKKITLYTSLGKFVNTLDKEDKVSQETIKKESIQATVFAGAPAFVVRNPNSISISPNMNVPVFMGRINPSGVLGVISAEGINSSLLTRVSLGNENNIFSSSIVTMKPNDNIFKIPETASAIFQSSTCTKCGKSYTPSLTTININGWCNECSSKNSGLFFVQ